MVFLNTSFPCQNPAKTKGNSIRISGDWQVCSVRKTVHEQMRPLRLRKAMLFDHLVGAAKQERAAPRGPELIGGLQVDEQLEFRQLLDRQIGDGLAARCECGRQRCRLVRHTRKSWPVARIRPADSRDTHATAFRIGLKRSGGYVKGEELLTVDILGKGAIRRRLSAVGAQLDQSQRPSDDHRFAAGFTQTWAATPGNVDASPIVFDR